MYGVLAVDRSMWCVDGVETKACFLFLLLQIFGDLRLLIITFRMYRSAGLSVARVGGLTWCIVRSVFHVYDIIIIIILLLLNIHTCVNKQTTNESLNLT